MVRDEEVIERQSFGKTYLLITSKVWENIILFIVDQLTNFPVRISVIIICSYFRIKTVKKKVVKKH